jgi:hypothetical protein
MMSGASRVQYAANIKKLISELGRLKVTLTVLGEWKQVETVDEMIGLTHELLHETERTLYH